jgi:hypothetical protein
MMAPKPEPDSLDLAIEDLALAIELLRRVSDRFRGYLQNIRDGLIERTEVLSPKEVEDVKLAVEWGLTAQLKWATFRGEHPAPLGYLEDSERDRHFVWTELEEVRSAAAQTGCTWDAILKNASRASEGIDGLGDEIDRASRSIVRGSRSIEASTTRREVTMTIQPLQGSVRSTAYVDSRRGPAKSRRTRKS